MLVLLPVLFLLLDLLLSLLLVVVNLTASCTERWAGRLLMVQLLDGKEKFHRLEIIIVIIIIQSCWQNACWPIFMCCQVEIMSWWLSLGHFQLACISIPYYICCRHCVCQNVLWNSSLLVPSPLLLAGCCYDHHCFLFSTAFCYFTFIVAK